MITQSACLDNVSNGCLASVAIETITGYFMDKSTAVQPRLFEEKKIIQHIKYELAKLVKGTKKYAQSIGVEIGKNVWEKFSSKLGKYNFNKITRSVSKGLDFLPLKRYNRREKWQSCQKSLLERWLNNGN